MRKPKTLLINSLMGLLASITLVAPQAIADNPPKKPNGDATKKAEKTTEQAVAEQKMLTQAIQRAIRAFVFVGARGSAVLVSADGYILTNDHVAGSQPFWRVRTVDGKTYKARLVGTDPYGDISLLKIESKKPLPYIEFGSTDQAKVGETVIAVGNPFGMSNIDERPTVTVGVISALCRPQIRKGLPDSVMTDAPINPGNSGGPLISLEGKLLGINGQIHTRTGTRSNTGIGYAISVDQIKRFMPILKKADGQMVKHGWIKGLNFENSEGGANLDVRMLYNPRIADRVKRMLAVTGCKIAAVPEGLTGVEVGDVITHVDGHRTLGAQHALARLISYPAGAKVELTLERGDETVKANVTLDAWFIRGQPDLGVQYVTAGGIRLEVKKVEEGKIADKAGLKVGDHVMSVAGIELRAPSVAALRHLRGQVYRNVFPRFARTGAEVECSIMRDGKPVQLALDFPRGFGKDDIGLELDAPEAAAGKVRKMQVRAVNAGGPAARAGVKPGDVILGVKKGDRDVNVTSQQELLMALVRRLQAGPGQKVTVLIERDGKKKALELILGLKRALD